MTRVHNFSAGPAGLPETVIQELGPHLIEFSDAGAGIMEISHRSKQFDEPVDRGEPKTADDYVVLFLQGGASLQFTMAPMNPTLDPMGYILSGHWANRATSKQHVSIGTDPLGWFEQLPDTPDADTPELSRVGTRWVHYTKQQHDLR